MSSSFRPSTVTWQEVRSQVRELFHGSTRWLSALGRHQTPHPGETPLLTILWNHNGDYIGRCVRESLMHKDGHEIGHIAEGDELYGFNGAYLGEIHHGNRLITNFHKSQWKRCPYHPSATVSPSHQRNLLPIAVPTGYADFSASS